MVFSSYKISYLKLQFFTANDFFFVLSTVKLPNGYLDLLLCPHFFFQNTYSLTDATSLFKLSVTKSPKLLQCQFQKQMTCLGISPLLRSRNSVTTPLRTLTNSFLYRTDHAFSCLLFWFLLFYIQKLIWARRSGSSL